MLVEGEERILRCLELLDEREIWWRPNAHSNSVGNLILHLNGNVRQWLIATFSETPDQRQRQQEFDTTSGWSKSELQQLVKILMQDAEQILNTLTPEQLVKTYQVQGFEEQGIGILIHVAEHFSYHVGQITYFVKAHKNLDTGYYEDFNLDITKD